MGVGLGWELDGGGEEGRNGRYCVRCFTGCNVPEVLDVIWLRDVFRG